MRFSYAAGTTPADRNSSASLSSDADDESHIVDNILGDIRSGFIQKKSFGDTAFTVTKVKKVAPNLIVYLLLSFHVIFCVSLCSGNKTLFKRSFDDNF